MLPKHLRLPRSARLREVKVLSHKLFILKYAHNGLEASRFRVVVTKKLDKRAVARNRMRRLWYIFIKEHMVIFPASYDYVVIVKTPFETISESTISDIKELVKKL